MRPTKLVYRKWGVTKRIDDFDVINDIKDVWLFCLNDRKCYLHGCLFCLPRGRLPSWLNMRDIL